MIILDANILLYSRDSSSAQHEAARSWLEETLNAEPDVRIGLISLLAFLRLSTDPRVFSRPLEPSAAIATIAEWLTLPNVTVAEPTDHHWPLLSELAMKGKARGPLLMDAHLAALVVEHGATLATSDRDFARFPGLRWVDPLAS
jgi:uncharacterized protein